VRLIVAEKPSVGKDIAKILGATSNKDGALEGKDCIVTWCIGHLVELAMPDAYDESLKKWSMASLPILPDEFKHNVNPSTQKQYAIVSRLLNDPRVTEVVCATDAGREGQLIFMYVYLLAGCTKPVKRLWINSMTDEAIKQGFEKLKSNDEYENLYQSARSRSEADWLVGINGTRLFTVKYNQKLTVGRVQTPTLAMIVNRHRAIQDFTAEPFYEVEANCTTFKATWFDDDGTRFSDEAKAEAIVAKCNGKAGIVSKLKKKKATADRPLLYDLTELQRESNRRYGYTAEETLEAAQALYEKHKLATYPRTDSRYLSSDIKAELPKLVQAIRTGVPKAAPHAEKLQQQGLNIDKRVINDAKVTDHHAIIVTPNIAGYARKSGSLSDRERAVLRLILTRFLVVLDQKQEYDQTDIELLIENERFRATGKKIRKPGWKAIEDALLGKPKVEETDGDGEPENTIDLNQGDAITPESVNLISKKTSPPKYYTEDTLLAAMETAGRAIEDEALREEMKSVGLGTPATRANIIEKLIASGYVERKKKNMLATDLGCSLIDRVPEKLKLPDLTGEWEQRLDQIAKGQGMADDFMEGIRQYVRDIVAENATASSGFRSGKEPVGTCPRCGKPVYEGEKSFYCSGYRDEPKCNFSMWKEDKFFTEKGKVLNAVAAEQLLRKGWVRAVNLKKREGDGTYNAVIRMVDTGTYVNYKLAFENGTTGRSEPGE